MDILVLGATGGTGLAVVEQALKAGHNVTALVRDARKFALRDRNLHIVVGDALDSNAVGRALLGCDTVISALGVRLGQDVGQTRSQASQVLVEKMAAHQVKRLIAVSAVGVGSSCQHQSFCARLLLPLIIGKERLEEVRRQEKIIAASDLEWTLVRPPRLQDGALSGAYRAALDLPTDLRSSVRRADLAHFLLQLAQQHQYVGQSVVVAN